MPSRVNPEYRRIASPASPAGTGGDWPGHWTPAQRDISWDTGQQRQRFEIPRIPGRLLACGVAAAIVAVPVVIAWTYSNPLAETLQRREAPSAEPRAMEPLAGFAEAKAVLDAFATATDIEQRLACVRHPGRTRERMLWFETCWESPPLGRQGIAGQISATANGANLWNDTSGRRFLSFDTRLVNGQLRTAWFEMDAAGVRLDWESFVFFEQVPWLDFTSGRLGGWIADPDNQESQIYRVHCEEGDYYNHRYADAEKLRAFKVDNPARAKACWAYAQRNSQAEQQLHVALLEGNGSCRVTLKLRCDLDGSPDQLWIEELVSPTWVYDAAERAE